MKVVVLDGYTANPGDLSWEPMSRLCQLTVYDRTPQNLVAERAADADAIIINKINVDATLLDSLPRLKYIGELATGFNNIDTAETHRRGITVCNIPSYSTMSVAQLVFAHLLNICFRPDHYAAETRQGKWADCPDFCYWDTPLIELDGKQMGIYGLGHIGSRVALLAHDFGMRVAAVTSKKADMLPEYVESMTLEEMLSTSDVITLHCPLTPQTHHLIDAQRLALMRPTAVLINTGRGPLVDDKAVADALEAHRLRAYCADVMTDEPPKADNPLLHQPNAFITPHIAWATREARQRLMDIATANLKAFIDGKPQNRV